MSKARIIALVLVVAVAAFFAIRVIRNALSSEEAKIKRLIKELASDFEEKKFKDVFERVAEDYSDSGEHTRDSLRKMSNALILYMKEADVSISDLRVVVSDDKTQAEAAFSAKVSMRTTMGDVDDALEEVTGSNKVKIKLRKEGGDWLIYESSLGKFNTGF